MYKIIELNKTEFPIELIKAEKENWKPVTQIFMNVVKDEILYCIMMKKEETK